MRHRIKPCTPKASSLKHATNAEGLKWAYVSSIQLPMQPQPCETDAENHRYFLADVDSRHPDWTEAVVSASGFSPLVLFIGRHFVNFLFFKRRLICHAFHQLLGSISPGVMVVISYKSISLIPQFYWSICKNDENLDLTLSQNSVGTWNRVEMSGRFLKHRSSMGLFETRWCTTSKNDYQRAAVLLSYDREGYGSQKVRDSHMSLTLRIIQIQVFCM